MSTYPHPVPLHDDKHAHPLVIQTADTTFTVGSRGFCSRYDADEYAKRQEGIDQWLELVDKLWPAPLTNRQRAVIVAMLHNHKRTHADWMGRYGSLPALEIGRDRRALNPDGFDQLHIQNRMNCVSAWEASK